MAVIINQINGGLDESEMSVIEKAVKSVGLNMRNVKKSGINKVSLDARKRNNIHFAINKLFLYFFANAGIADCHYKIG